MIWLTNCTHQDKDGREKHELDQIAQDFPDSLYGSSGTNSHKAQATNHFYAACRAPAWAECASADGRLASRTESPAGRPNYGKNATSLSVYFCIGNGGRTVLRCSPAPADWIASEDDIFSPGSSRGPERAQSGKGCLDRSGNWSW